MTIIERIQGIFLNPQQTFPALSEKPLWKDAMILLLMAWVLFGYITGPYSLQDNVKFMESNVRLRERMGEEQFNKALENLRNPSPTSKILRLFVLSPLSLLIGLLLSSLVLLVMGRLTSTEGKFIQVFSAYLHANFIDKILGNAIRLVLVLLRKSYMQTTTSLALLFPNLEVTSSAYIILSQVDFFQLWMFGILGYGLSAIFKAPLKKALILSYSFWLLKSILYISISLVSMQFLR